LNIDINQPLKDM